MTILSYPNKKIIFLYTHAPSIALGRYLVSCTKCSVHVALNEPFVSWTKGVFFYISGLHSQKRDLVSWTRGICRSWVALRGWRWMVCRSPAAFPWSPAACSPGTGSDWTGSSAWRGPPGRLCFLLRTDHLYRR